MATQKGDPGTIEALKPSGAEVPNSKPTKKENIKLKGRKTTTVFTPFFFKNGGRVSLCSIPYYTCNAKNLSQVTEEQVLEIDAASGKLQPTGLVRHGASVKVHMGEPGKGNASKKIHTLMFPSSANRADIFYHITQLNEKYATNIYWFQRESGRRIWVKKLSELAAAAAGG